MINAIANVRAYDNTVIQVVVKLRLFLATFWYPGILYVVTIYIGSVDIKLHLSRVIRNKEESGEADLTDMSENSCVVIDFINHPDCDS